MTLNLELPPDLESAARKIPDLQDRVASFVRHQIDIEKWREGRYCEKARQLAHQSKVEADKLKDAAYSREELFLEFFDLHDRICAKL